MATAARLENTVSGGMSSIKEFMKNGKTQIAELNAKAERAEKEAEQAKRAYAKAVGRQQAMRDRQNDVETKLSKNEERLKEMTKRVSEKERFLEDSKKFHKNLTTVVPEEGMVQETEERLKAYKEIYGKNYDRYSKAKERKSQLEFNVEHAELRAHEAIRRVEALNLELEYNVIEDSRRSECCKQSIDKAFKSEKDLLDLQRAMDELMKRKEIATKKINSFESKIEKTENTIETTNFERRRIEATIRELLLNIKGQAESQKAGGR